MNKVSNLGVVCLLIALLIGSFACLTDTRIEYEFVGKYEYEIVDESQFEGTFLFESYGYVIGDVDIVGLKIEGADNLNKSTDYLISFEYPVARIYESLDGVAYPKTPIEASQELDKKTSHVYIYDLKIKNKYRLRLP